MRLGVHVGIKNIPKKAQIVQTGKNLPLDRSSFWKAVCNDRRDFQENCVAHGKFKMFIRVPMSIKST